MKNVTTCIAGAVAILLVSEMIAGADVYREAHQLVLRAEAMFQLRRTNDALALLRQVLVRQKRQGKPYGYARYVYFRRAKHLISEGKPKRARAELTRALKITEGQQLVAARFRVERHHPFIVKHFPQLAGFAWQRYALNAVAPAEVLDPADGGRFVYAVGKHAVYRLDRRGRTKLKLHQATRGKITAFAATADQRRSATIVSRGKRTELHTLQLDPFEETVVPVPTNPRSLALDGEAAVLFTNVNRTTRVQRILKDGRPRSSLSIRGALLQGSAKAMIYATWARRRHAFHTIAYAKLAKGAKPVQLYRFEAVDRRNRVSVTTGRSGQTFALFITEPVRNERHVVTFDARKKTRRASRHKIALLAPPEPAVRFSRKEDYLVLLQRLGTKLRVFRMTLAGQSRALATISTKAGSGKVHGFGVMKDNKRIWLHLGGDLLIVDPTARKQSRTRLPHWSKGDSWTGHDHYFADPEQWFIGIARSGQPSTFMAISPKTFQ